MSNYFHITSKLSDDMVLSVQGASTEAITNLVLGTKAFSSDSQIWQNVGTGSTDPGGGQNNFFIQSKLKTASGQTLVADVTANSPTAGTQVISYPEKSPAAPNQTWQMIASANHSGYFYITSNLSSAQGTPLVMTVDGAFAKQGSNVLSANKTTCQIKSSAFAPTSPGECDNQLWKLEPYVASDFHWAVLPNSPIAGSRTDDIWFFDGLTGWLVNSSGYVCKTEDGGNSWVPMFFLNPTTGGKPYLRCMGWANRQYGWFGSVTQLADNDLEYPGQYINTLLHYTRDGGETWSPVLNLPDNAPSGICGCYAVNEKVFYGSGTNDPGMPGPAIVKTVDGGDSWEVIDMRPYADNLIDIYFLDELNGFVVGGKISTDCPTSPPGYQDQRFSRYAQVKPVVLRTSDGGQTWVNTAAATQGLSCGEWGWKIQFLNETTGFISLENFVSAAILRTTDGGNSWVRHDVKDSAGDIINEDLEGIGFLEADQGWVGGWSENFDGLKNSYTTDGGQTWTAQNHVVGNSASDPRLKINRYRFVGNPITAGFCSGQQVYQLVPGSNTKKSAFAATSVSTQDASKTSASKTSAMAAQSDPGSTAQSTTMQAKTNALVMPQDSFQLSYQKLADGALKINYTLADDSENVFVGLWNKFAFHVRTLVKLPNQGKGLQQVIWDGKDDNGESVGEGIFICRMSTGNNLGASRMVEIEPTT